MASLNKVMLIGNLTRDPEVRYTPKGQAVTDIALAVNRTYLVDGQKREEVTYVDVTFWGKAAEIIGQYMKKGRPMYVEGRLRLDTWDDKTTGQKRSRLTVTGDEFQFLGSREGSGQGGGGGDYDDRPRSGGGGGGGYSQGRGQQGQGGGYGGGQGGGAGYSSSGGGGGYGGGDYDDGPPPPSRSTGSSAGGGGSPRPDAFPPGMDDDEIPF